MFLSRSSRVRVSLYLPALRIVAPAMVTCVLFCLHVNAGVWPGQLVSNAIFLPSILVPPTGAVP